MLLSAYSATNSAASAVKSVGFVMSTSHNKTHATETPDASHIKNVDVTHEKSDVQVGSIAKFVVGLLILTIATHIALWGMFRMLEAGEAKKDTRRSPMALSDQERLPPEPRLQSAPAFGQELERQRSAQQHSEERSETAGEGLEKPKDPLWEIKVLEKQWHDVLEHGPVDKDGKRYGMPIEKAKDELLKQGLPVRKQ